MSHEFRLPAEIAEADAEGFVVNWFRDEGQAVRAGDLLLEVQFDKVSTEVYSPADGVLERILCPQGETVKAGQPLCLIREREGAGAPAPPDVRATPAARRRARELAIALADVPGTGPGGRITEEDVEAFAGAKAGAGASPPGPGSRREPLSPAQRLTGERMLQSLREAAQFTLGREAEVTALVAVRAELRQAGSPVSLSDLLHRAVVLALAEHPRLQARLDGDFLVMPEAVHLGFAVARDDDLLAPVIRGAQNLGLAELAAERQRLTAAVLTGRIQPGDLQGATFTVSNLGPYGCDFFTPILNPPQSAIVGVGRTVERPAIRRGEVVPATYLTLTLTVDHRVVNGAPAAAFLARLADLLARPEGWVPRG